MEPENFDEQFMLKAIESAKLAALKLEVPVGAIVVYEGKIISSGWNRREKSKSALAHAEIEAIHGACKALNRWRLFGCTLYVTLEPCPMCAGAIINSRLERLVYGAKDTKAGSCGSVVNLFNLPYNHKPEVTQGILEGQCSAMLTEFFKNIRKSKKFVTTQN